MDIEKKRKNAVELFESIPITEIDDVPSREGVLLSDNINHYAQTYTMINPFNPDNLKAAGYELTIGDEFYIGGDKFCFSSDKAPAHIEIPPFEVAVIKTEEILRIPRFLIARWNLRAQWAYKGLLWVGAAQVDPGYAGHLFCPIFNLSDRPVRLNKGERIALMDFVKTTTFDPDHSLRYPKPSERRRNIIEDYECEELKSALVKHAQERIQQTEDKVELVEGRLSLFVTIIISVLALGVSIVLSSKAIKTIEVDNWQIWVIFFMSSFSFLGTCLFFAYWRFQRIFSVIVRGFWGRNIHNLKYLLVREWRASIVVVPLIVAVVGVSSYFLTREFDDRAYKERQELNETVKKLQHQIEEIKKSIKLDASN